LIKGADYDRWIVKSRSDGKNVDNWHWTERDLFDWCKARFENSLTKIKIPSSQEPLELMINRVDTVKGSMIVCNRKGKTLYIYDVQLKLNWEGKLKTSQVDPIEEEVTSKGFIQVTDISNNEEKCQISLRTEDEKSDSTQNPEIVAELKKNVRSVIEKVISEILQEMRGFKASKEPEVIPETLKVRHATCRITFCASPSQLYKALVEPDQTNLKMSYLGLFESKGQGYQVELLTDSKIVHKWRLINWPPNHYSQVIITLSHHGTEGTHLSLSHQEIPSSHYDTLLTEWGKFWNKFRNLFGYEYTALEWI